jgi:hypothetical protein
VVVRCEPISEDWSAACFDQVSRVCLAMLVDGSRSNRSSSASSMSCRGDEWGGTSRGEKKGVFGIFPHTG